MGARRRIDLGLSSTGISEHTALSWVVPEARTTMNHIPEEKDFGVTRVPPAWNARYGEHVGAAYTRNRDWTLLLRDSR